MTKLKPGMLCRLPNRIWYKKRNKQLIRFPNRDEILMFLEQTKISAPGQGYDYWFLNSSGEKISIDYEGGLEVFQERHVELLTKEDEDNNGED